MHILITNILIIGKNKNICFKQRLHVKPSIQKQLLYKLDQLNKLLITFLHMKPIFCIKYSRVRFNPIICIPAFQNNLHVTIRSIDCLLITIINTKNNKA